MATIQDYIRLSVKDCKRLGYFKEKHYCKGSVKWTQRGNVVASICFVTDLRGVVPYAVLGYDYKGETVRTEITLRFKPSNLNNGTGFYYFVCPVTGLSCRNLYLVDGRFVSRQAFRPLYPKQVEGERARKKNAALNTLRALGEYHDLLNEKNRRLTYNGKATPYGRKVEKYERIAARLLGESNLHA